MIVCAAEDDIFSKDGNGWRLYLCRRLVWQYGMPCFAIERPKGRSGAREDKVTWRYCNWMSTIPNLVVFPCLVP